MYQTKALDVQYKTVVGTVIGVVLANVAVALRLISKRIGKKELTIDDYLMFVALAFHWSIVIGGIVMLYNGLGLPLSKVSPDKLMIFFKTQYVGSFLYAYTIALIKSSILALYWRVFDRRQARLLVLIGLILVGAWTFAVCVTGAVACTPTRKMWIPQVEGTCIDIAAFYYGAQIPNILTDIYIILLPIREVLKLELAPYQRISLLAILCSAMVTVIFDIIRLVTIVELSKSTEDITVAITDTTVWTCIEPAAAMLTACLSNVRPLYRWIFEKYRNRREELLGLDEVEKEVKVSGESIQRTIQTSASMKSVDTRLYASSDVEQNILINGPFGSAYATTTISRPLSHCHSDAGTRTSTSLRGIGFPSSENAPVQSTSDITYQPMQLSLHRNGDER